MIRLFSTLALVVLLAVQLAIAITEDVDEVAMRDATVTRERPNLLYDLDEETMEEAEQSKENFNFAADVSRLMDIIINSLYTKREVFLRELISNASDALDKARFMELTDSDYLGKVQSLHIQIDYDAEARTLSVQDTGVGMTRAELVKNLGTVAKSGTTAFLEAAGAAGDSDSMSMIGQFGVGFYSAFLVANKVTVVSKSNDDDQYIWSSTADARFYISKDPRGNTLGRGTRVTLHLKDDASEFLEQEKIRTLVKRYSEFINYPIKLYTSVEEQREIEDTDEEAVEENSNDEEEIDITLGQDGFEVISEDESDQDEMEKGPKMKTVIKQVWKWKTLNDIKAIWLRPRDEIEDHEYEGFYKTISKDAEAPLAWSHFSAEGEIEFKAILYVPRSAPFDMFDNYYQKSSALKLYVRRVLITEEFEDLMPRYLSFIKGVVDSDDLPLNVSREQLQQMKMLRVMSKKLVRKTLDMIRDIAEESYEEIDEDDEDKQEDENIVDVQKATESETEKTEEDTEDEEDKYEVFWSQFGKNIKFGIMEDQSNRQKLARLLRFESTFDLDGDLTSLDEYISRMKEDQDTILFLPGDSRSIILQSPILKSYIKGGYEVLILSDPIDEYVFNHLNDYNNRKCRSIAKDEVNLLEGSDAIAKKKQQKLKEMYKPLTEWFKGRLGKQVEKVQISNKLGDTPLFIFTSQYGYSAQMEKISKAQAFQKQDEQASYMLARKTLELNPHHPVMKQLLETLKSSEEGQLDEVQSEYADLLFQMAMLNSGFGLDEPTQLTTPLEKLIKVGLGIDRNSEVVEIEIEIEEDEQPEVDDEYPEFDEESINWEEMAEQDIRMNEEL